MIWELPRELMQAGEHGRKGEKGKLAGESHKTRLRCLECRQSYQVSVATGMSPWLHCVQEGWGRPTLRRPSWAVWVLMGLACDGRVGWLFSEQPCVGRDRKGSLHPPVRGEGASAAWMGHCCQTHVPRLSRFLGTDPHLHCERPILFLGKWSWLVWG